MHLGLTLYFPSSRWDKRYLGISSHGEGKMLKQSRNVQVLSQASASVTTASIPWVKESFRPSQDVIAQLHDKEHG